MARAGLLRHRIAFEQRGLDDQGDRLGAWAVAFEAMAGLRPLLSGETVLGARLEGRQTYVCEIHDCADARAVTTDWRAYDARNESRTFNIRSGPIEQLDRKTGHPTRMLELLIEEGRADGR